MKKSQWTILCALVMLLLWAMPVGAFEIGARALYWFPTFKADMTADSAGLAGTAINMEDDLGMGKESFPTFEAFGGMGRHHFSLAYTPIKYSGSTRLTTPVTFDGQTFAAGANVNTDMKLRMLDLEYRYTFLDMENILAGFSLDAIGQVKYVDGEIKMHDPAASTEAAVALRTPVPMIGVGAHIGLLAGILEARAKVAGVAYSDSYIYEALADLSLTPFPFLDIHVGYKVIRLKIDQNDVFLNSQFTGPYIGMTVSF
jgi:hypothetical protein